MFYGIRIGSLGLPGYGGGGGYTYLDGELDARTSLGFSDTQTHATLQALMINGDPATDLDADGFTLIDHSESSNDGALVESPCVVMSGGDIQRGSRLTSGTMTAVTLTLWMKTTASGSTRAIAAEYNTTGNQRMWQLRLSSTGQLSAVLSVDGTATYSTTAAGTVNDGAWHFVSMVFNAGNIAIAVDGSDIFSASDAPASIYNGTAEFRIASLNGAAIYTGSLDDVRIYQSALDAGQLASVRAGASVGTPVGWFPMCEQDGLLLYNVGSAGGTMSFNGETAANVWATTQDKTHHVYRFGATVYENGGSYILVPNKADTTAPTHSDPVGYSETEQTTGGKLPVGCSTSVSLYGGGTWTPGDGQQTTPYYHAGETAGPFWQFFAFDT